LGKPPAKRPKRTRKVVEQERRREKRSDSTIVPAEGQTPAEGERGLAARDSRRKAAAGNGDALFKRVSSSMMRLQSRRRLRVLCRRLLLLLLLVGALIALWYLLGQPSIKDLFEDYWRQIQQKLNLSGTR
jgi:hypothetical protein